MYGFMVDGWKLNGKMDKCQMDGWMDVGLMNGWRGRGGTIGAQRSSLPLSLKKR